MKKNPRLTTTACLAILALATASTSMAALLTNGGFESATAPGAPTAWTLNLSGGSALTSIAYAQSGSQSLVIDSTGAGAWNSPNAFQEFAASAGQEFNFQGYMLRSGAITDASFGLLKMEFRDAANAILLPASASIGGINNSFPGVESTPFLNNGSVGVDTWLFTQLQGVAPTNTAKVQFYLLNVNQGVAPGPMYFDNISATLIPEPSALALTG
ncbi:MAG: hypothetical protein ACRDBP_03640, partial [Luteolibacter sp.]